MNSWPRNHRVGIRAVLAGVATLLVLPTVGVVAGDGDAVAVDHTDAHRLSVQDLQGNVLTGVFGGMDEQGRLVVFGADGDADSYEASDIERVVFAPDGDAASVRFATVDGSNADSVVGGVQFEFANQGKMRAAVVRSSDDVIVAAHRLLGECRIATGDLSAVRFMDGGSNVDAEQLFAIERAESHTGVDVLISVRDGRVRGVRGVLAALGPDSGEFEFRGERRTFRYEHAYAVVLAAGATDQRKASNRSKAVLIDGTTLPGAPASSGADVVQWLMPSGHALQLPIEALAALEFASDRIVYVSDLTPVDEVSGTILQVEPWPMRRDRNAANGLMAMDGRAYRKGVGVHARSALSYLLDGQFITFAATIGIDDSVRPAGNVVFQVIGDGRVLFDSGSVTGRDTARNMRADVAGVSRMTLLVDFGDELDIGDVANWADARFVRPAERATKTGDGR